MTAGDGRCQTSDKDVRRGQAMAGEAGDGKIRKRLVNDEREMAGDGKIRKGLWID